MASNWVRPPAEEEQFNRLARILDIPKEELCACQRGLRRFIKKFILASTTSQGKCEDHLVVLLNDVVIVAENAIMKRHEEHEFDIQHTIPLLGLAVSSHPGCILLEHNQEGLHVVLEGKDTVLKQAYESIQAEVESVNDVVEHHPTSVVRPSKDPRRRSKSENCDSYDDLLLPNTCRDNENGFNITEDDHMHELQRAAAAAEAKMRRRRKRKSRSVHPEIQEITEDDDIQVITGVRFEETEEESASAMKARSERLMIEAIFGGNHDIVRAMHQVQFAEDIIMMDDDWVPNCYQIVCFLDFFVVQKYPATVKQKKIKRSRSNRTPPPTIDSDDSESQDRDEFEDVTITYPYEGYFLGDCEPSVHPYTEHSALVELKWKQKTYRMEMDRIEAEIWLEKIETCIMISKASVDIEDFGVIGSCVVKRDEMSYGTKAPETAKIHRDAESEYANVLQVQKSLGPNCNWIVGDRRTLISQVPMHMYNKDGNVEQHRVIILSDRLLITKPAEEKYHHNHTHDVLENIDILNVRYSHDNVIISVKHPHGKRFLCTRDGEMAKQWIAIAETTALRKRERDEMVKNNIEFYQEEQRKIMRAQAAAHALRLRREQLRQMDMRLLQQIEMQQPKVPEASLPTHASDPNLEEENDDDCIILDDSPTKSPTRVTSDNDMEYVPPTPYDSPNETRCGNKSEDENQENDESELHAPPSTNKDCDQPSQISAPKRRASSPLPQEHQPKKKHPRLRLSFRTPPPSVHPENVETTLPIADQPQERVPSTAPTQNYFAPPLRLSIRRPYTSLFLPRGRTQFERERNAILMSQHLRNQIEERMWARKRREGQGSSKDCFLQSPSRPSTPVRIMLQSPNPFVDSLFEDTEDALEPSSSRHNAASQSTTMNDTEEDVSYEDTSNEADISAEINEDDLLIPEDKDDGYIPLSGSITQPSSTDEDEKMVDVVDDSSDNESQENDDVISAENELAYNEEIEDEFLELDDESSTENIATNKLGENGINGEKMDGINDLANGIVVMINGSLDDEVIKILPTADIDEVAENDENGVPAL